MMRLTTATLLCLVFALYTDFANADGHRASFSIAFEGLETNLNIMTTAVMPGRTLRVTTQGVATADQGSLNQSGAYWIWTATTTPGLATLTFSHNAEAITLNVFILTPFRNGEQDSLDGYRIGRYATSLFRGLTSYAAPEGFINMSHAPEGFRIAPHFTLEQFICKQQPGHDPSFILVRPAMLIKLEALLDAANARGWTAETFFVMSGFRTPFYNRSIGNDTDSSRHLYGGAADIWIDNDGDGLMDDLNRDGRITKDDARELAKLAESLAVAGGSNWPAGGIGIYSANTAHGPFVHIDARGYRARWD